MRPLGIYFMLEYLYIYIEYDSFHDDFGRFRRFFLNANGRNHGRTDIRTYGHTDGRTDPHIEMRGRI